MRYVISFLLIFILFFILLDIPSFITEDSGLILKNINDIIKDVLIFNISILLFTSSIVLFISGSVKIKGPKNELKQPSIRDARRGDIKIGKIKKHNSLEYSFYLSIEDLEKHMFICGSTGTGKSNFLQHFLINLVKKFEIPFFLVEFKGEYHFLQHKIDNLLILWPGENFSINIFDPLGADPIIHQKGFLIF